MNAALQHTQTIRSTQTGGCVGAPQIGPQAHAAAAATSFPSWLLPPTVGQQPGSCSSGLGSPAPGCCRRPAAARRPPPPTHLPCFFSSAIVPLTLLASVLAAIAATRSAEQRLPCFLLLLLLLLGACGCCWPRRSGWAALLLTQRLLLVMLRGQCATVALHRAEMSDMDVLGGAAWAHWHSSTVMLSPDSAQLPAQQRIGCSQPIISLSKRPSCPQHLMWASTASVQPAVASLQCPRSINAHNTRPAAKPCGAPMPAQAFPRRDSARQCP